MHAVLSAELGLSPSEILPIVADLATYPHWLDLVSAVDTAEPVGGDAGPAWLVTLTAKLGPFARSKQLRMVQTARTDEAVTFDRAEIDGRDHSNWQMVSTVAAVAGQSNQATLTMDLRYDGSLFSSALEKILEHAADDAGAKLEAYARSGGSGLGQGHEVE